MADDSVEMEDVSVSDRTLRVGSLSAGPGERRYGVNEFVVQQQPYRLPTWLINGNADGPTLVVTGGVHAAEYASIAAALDLVSSLAINRTDPLLAVGA
jgi:uncharacterized protein